MNFEADYIRLQLQAILRHEYDDEVPQLASKFCRVIPLQRSLRASSQSTDTASFEDTAGRLEALIDEMEQQFAGKLHEGNFYQLLMDCRLAVEAGNEDRLLSGLMQIAGDSRDQQEGLEP